jgi:phage baseplate assembly protein W
MALPTTTVTKKAVNYSDFRADLLHPAYGDLVVIQNEDAIIRSIKNILLTDNYERPFRPRFGANLKALLFENISSVSELQIKNAITNAIQNYEPRANLETVYVVASPDQNAYNVTIVFSVINKIDPIIFTVILNRVR